MSEVNFTSEANSTSSAEVLFKVVFRGVLPGFDSHKVEADFAQLFSLDSVRAAKIFETPNTVLKSGLTQELADKYIARLVAIGVDAAAIAQESAQLEIDPAAVEPVAPVADSSERELAFEFHGKGGEYFKIWIVNILLSIVTLGIYSAWAKVRNHQYFYGNTRLNEASFEYTANPLNILKGRIIAVVLFGGYSVLTHTAPIGALIMGLLLVIAMPWLVVMSLRFNARYTSYRNIPFQFKGSVWGAAKAIILWPILGVMTLGALMPFAWKRHLEFVVQNHAYGESDFSLKVKVGELYKMLLLILGGSVVFFFVIGILSAVFLAIGAAIGMVDDASASPGKMNPGMIIGVVLIYAITIGYYMLIGAYFATTMANIQYNNTQLAGHRFKSNWNPMSYAGLLVTNTFFILITLGLYIPFAKVRTAAYKAQHTQFVALGSLDSFVAAEKAQVNSMAEGVHDIFALDISI